jgi:hypothetical protein
MATLMKDTRGAVSVLGLMIMLMVMVVLLTFSALPALGDTTAASPDSMAGNLVKDRPVDPYTWVDHDGYPAISKPKERKINLFYYYFVEGLEEPLSRLFDIPGKILWLLDAMGVAESDYDAANVNAFDEVANSSWFTNRNHVKAVSVDEIRRGPEDHLRPKAPWTIKSPKEEGVNPGFQIKDADGKRWVVKFDPPGYPQIGSGADVVSSRLLLAAGFNLPHDVALTFRREDLVIDEDLVQGKDGEKPFTDDDLDRLMARGHRGDDGEYYALASLFLSGEPLGPFSLRKRRSDDPNDWYTHSRRRELRGLYVIASWLNHWDTKEQQSLDMFEEREDSLGYVKHYLLDVGATLGAAAEGPKPLKHGFENQADFAWIGKRLITLGFITEPWRKAKQETGIRSVGHFSSVEFDPKAFKPTIPNPAFKELSDNDAYWGAKIVASFSNAQIQAAIDAAGYEDPRAREYLLKTLIERRDKIARYWFGRVAPLDYFHIKDGILRFHDLAVDLGIEPSREYEVHIESVDDGEVAPNNVRLSERALSLSSLASGGQRVRLRLFLVGSAAKPTTVELMRRGEEWLVASVRHA